MLTPTNRAALPVSSEPPDTTLIPTNTPKLQPQGATPIAPATPAAPSVPTLPVAPTTGGDVAKPAATGNTASAPAAPAAPTASQGLTAPMSSTPTPPSPYQTTDPLAFLPAPSPPTGDPFGSLPPATGFYNDPMTPGNSAPAAPAMQTPPPITAPLPQTTSAATADPLNPTAGILPQASSNGTVNLTPTTPSNSLANYTITPGALADRFGIAQSRIADWNAQEEPIFDRTIQDISQNRAGAGQIGSGMVRGAFRDAATTYDQQRLSAQKGFLNDALTGSIDDAYKNVGIAQQQQGVQIGQAQQGFNNNMSLQQLQDSESGQQWTQLMQSLGFNADQMQKAFENAYKVQQLSDDETGQAFSRALQEAIFGASGDPTQIEEYLAGLYALPQGTTTTIGGAK